MMSCMKNKLRGTEVTFNVSALSWSQSSTWEKILHSDLAVQYLSLRQNGSKIGDHDLAKK